MKLNIIKGVDGSGKQYVVGWNFTAENEQEEKDLSLVRDCIFFGIDKTYPQYSGRTDNPETDLVKKLWYRIPKYADTIDKKNGLEVSDPEAKSMLKSWN